LCYLPVSYETSAGKAFAAFIIVATSSCANLDNAWLADDNQLLSFALSGLFRQNFATGYC
jgi:hypothetical protein